MAEIELEVRRRRASGDLPARVERELDELFLEFSPVAGRGGVLEDALHQVDASAFIDPVVPIDSNKSGGAVLKKGMRTAGLWYVQWVTQQMNQFTAALSRALHLMDQQLTELSRQVETQRIPPAPVLDVPGQHAADAWWAPAALDALTGAPGRVLHAGCGDGWLVAALGARGIDAYGVDPRPGRTDAAERSGLDLRQDAVADHLRSCASAALGGLVLTGVVEGMAAGERDQLLALVADRVVPGGTVVIHSLTPAVWAAASLPPEADLAPGRPLRPATWVHLLSHLGAAPAAAEGPDGADFVVRATLGPPPATR
jgi:hypothetical protein